MYGNAGVDVGCCRSCMQMQERTRGGGFRLNESIMFKTGLVWCKVITDRGK
jgi:hypothetical protein